MFCLGYSEYIVTRFTNGWISSEPVYLDILYEENTVHIYYSKDDINAVFTLPNGINITHAYMVKVANAAKLVFGYYYNLHHICRTNDESETVVKTVQDITPDVVKYMRYIEDKANGRYHGYCR